MPESDARRVVLYNHGVGLTDFHYSLGLVLPNAKAVVWLGFYNAWTVYETFHALPPQKEVERAAAMDWPTAEKVARKLLTEQEPTPLGIADDVGINGAGDIMASVSDLFGGLFLRAEEVTEQFSAEYDDENRRQDRAQCIFNYEYFVDLECQRRLEEQQTKMREVGEAANPEFSGLTPTD